MMTKRLCGWIVASAIVAIASFAMPSLAQAHAGHHHHHAAASILAADTASSEAEPAAQDRHEVVSAGLAGAADQGTPACGGILCCGNTFCASCASVLAAQAAPLEPLTGTATAYLHDPGVPSGTGPSDLSRPPRSFV